MRAVVWTDVFQFVVMVTGLLAMLIQVRCDFWFPFLLNLFLFFRASSLLVESAKFGKSTPMEVALTLEGEFKVSKSSHQHVGSAYPGRLVCCHISGQF
jgi:Na+(H+)/acetate symporter ActP